MDRLLAAEDAALRNPSATWYWGLAGYVCIDAGGRLTGAGDKTQICHSLCGAKNKAPAMIRTKKDALADAYAALVKAVHAVAPGVLKESRFEHLDKALHAKHIKACNTDFEAGKAEPAARIGDQRLACCLSGFHCRCRD